ncbi:MAG: hypothetical protein HQ542_05745 [Bacteroidia bacterium]|nr:hypothetical protein [Bacteroidia bacterium]
MAKHILLNFPLFFLLIVSAFPQGTWERIDVPTTQNLQSVCFTDSLYGWAVGDSGTIIHTTDGGENWGLQDSPIMNDIVTVFFLDQNLGWASAINYTTPPYGSILLKTFNGGADWTSLPYPEENIFITCIHFFDSLTGWMGGKPHALVKTIDGGNNWTQAAIDTSTLAFFPVLKLVFLNEEVGYACGGMFDIAGVIWRTYNGGDLWFAIDPSQAPADEVHSIYIFDELNVMGSGGDPDYGYGVGMIRSDDGGINWNYEDIGVQGIAYDLDFRTASQAWSPLGSQRKLIFSLDTGNTWTEMPTPDSTSIFAITFPDSLNGCAVGNEGAMLKYKSPVYPAIPPLPDQLYEIQVQLYPNPTEGNLKFKIRTGAKRSSAQPNLKPGFTSIQVYTLLGAEVARLVNEELAPGEYSFPFDAGHLQDGIYLYQLQVDGVIHAIGKMVVIR